MSNESDKVTDPAALESAETPPGDSPAFRLPGELPVLPLRDTVLFPNSFMPLAVARESSVRLIDEAVSSGSLIAVFTQRTSSRFGGRSRIDLIRPKSPIASPARPAMSLAPIAFATSAP